MALIIAPEGMDYLLISVPSQFCKGCLQEM